MIRGAPTHATPGGTPTHATPTRGAPIQDAPPHSGWVCYDGECALCTSLAERFGQGLLRRGFRLEVLQAPWVRQRLGRGPGEVEDEMKLLTPDGRVFGGAEAVAEIFRSVWWGWPLWLATRLPGARRLLRAAYWQIAHRRYCAGGSCAARPPRSQK
jgi:predicted DCC family thiol-disulfide oxidoreductase YuxK